MVVKEDRFGSYISACQILAAHVVFYLMKFYFPESTEYFYIYLGPTFYSYFKEELLIDVYKVITLIGWMGTSSKCY